MVSTTKSDTSIMKKMASSKEPEIVTNGWKEPKVDSIPGPKGAVAQLSSARKPSTKTSAVTKEEKPAPSSKQQPIAIEKRPAADKASSNNSPATKLSYLAATTSSRPSVKTTAAATKSTVQPGGKAAATPKPVPVALIKTNKNKPSETLQLDLLQLALRARKVEEEKKNRPTQGSAPGKSSLKKQQNVVINAAVGGVVPKIRGKVRGAGEQARRKNRLTSLKKSILSERKARWWLAHPEAKPFPLVSHPALMEHDCVWLLQRREGEETDSDSGESEPIGDDNTVEEQEDSTWKVADDEDSGHGEAEEDESEDSDQELSDAGNHDTEGEEEAHSQVTKESTSDNQQSSPFVGSVGFDPALASPVYFGAIFKRQISAHLPEGSNVNDEEKQADKKQKGRIAAVPLARPVRDYVTQALSKELDELVLSTVSTLHKFQERARHEDPTKAKLRRRLVMGLHEVRRGARSRKCIAVVVASNIEDLSQLDEKIHEILTICVEPPATPTVPSSAPVTEKRSLAFGSGKNAAQMDAGDVIWEPIPVIFTSSKKDLGHSLRKRASVSCVGIYSADGAHDQFKQCLAKAKLLSEFWKSQVEWEKRQAEHGKRVICGSCGKVVMDLARRDCIKCKLTYCESCASSRASKKISCPATPLTETDELKKLCDIVRVARTLPMVAPKSLSFNAAVFVPKLPEVTAKSSHVIQPPLIHMYASASASTFSPLVVDLAADEDELVQQAVKAAVPQKVVNS